MSKLRTETPKYMHRRFQLRLGSAPTHVSYFRQTSVKLRVTANRTVVRYYAKLRPNFNEKKRNFVQFQLKIRSSGKF